MPNVNYQVVVSNIGNVSTTYDADLAASMFADYRQLSQSGKGRASGEIVTLFADGEIIREYYPKALPLFDASKVSYVVLVELDDTEIVGNAMASGDDKIDANYERAILQRVELGDVWAWALVRVTAHYPGTSIVGVDCLGACTYASEAEFRECQYFADMQGEASSELEGMLRDAKIVYDGEPVHA